MSLQSLLLSATVASAGIAVSAPAHASDLYARLLVGPAYLYYDEYERSSDVKASGPGLVSQLDVGARFGRVLALNASLVYDTSYWLRFNQDWLGDGSHELTVFGMGIGATGTWNRLSLGAVLGGQFTSFPSGDGVIPVPEEGGFGPLFSVSAGYVLPEAWENFELGVHVVGRHRFGEDWYNPPGYHLGLGFSMALRDARSADELERKELEREDLQLEELGLKEPKPQAEPSFGYASAQLGWWNAEIEFLSQVGIYFAVGVPWVKGVEGVLDDLRAFIPFGGRVGFHLDVSDEWAVRASAHLVGWRDLDQDCRICESFTETWQLFELGARHRSASGVIYGIDVPVLAIENFLGLEVRDRYDEDVWFPPHSFGFTQLYVGYSWGL